MEASVNLTPEIIEVSMQSLPIPEQAKALKIADASTYSKAGELWKNIRAIRAKVAESFNPLIKHAHDLHKATLAKKGEIDKPLEDAERTVKGAMEKYSTEQERKRQEEQRRLAEIARKQAEEQALLDAIAAEEEAMRNGATKEEAAQEATAIINEPVYVAPVVIQKEVPKVQGVSFREVWKFRITDEKKIPREYLMPDLIKLGALARALKGQFNVPGAEAYSERV